MTFSHIFFWFFRLKILSSYITLDWWFVWLFLLLILNLLFTISQFRTIIIFIICFYFSLLNFWIVEFSILYEEYISVYLSSEFLPFWDYSCWIHNHKIYVSKIQSPLLQFFFDHFNHIFRCSRFFIINLAE